MNLQEAWQAFGYYISHRYKMLYLRREKEIC